SGGGGEAGWLVSAGGGSLGSGASGRTADSRSRSRARSTGVALSAASRSGCTGADPVPSECGSVLLARQLRDQIETSALSSALGSSSNVGEAPSATLSPGAKASVAENEGRPGRVGARELASLASSWR